MTEKKTRRIGISVESLSFNHCVYSKMIVVTAVALLTISSFAAGEPQAICPNEPIKAVQGGGVDLPCWLDSLVNLCARTVDWQRVDLKKIVHACRHGHDDPDPQMEQYRNRTTVNHDDLSRGVMTLHISSLQLSDAGPYKCYVPLLKVGCTVDLIVFEALNENRTQGGESSTTGPPVEDVTKPAGCDAAVRIITGSVVGGAFAAAVCVIFILVMCGKIQVCKKTFRGMRAQEAETDAERKSLRTQTTEDEDPHSAAEIGLRELVP